MPGIPELSGSYMDGGDGGEGGTICSLRSVGTLTHSAISGLPSQERFTHQMSFI